MNSIDRLERRIGWQKAIVATPTVAAQVQVITKVPLSLA
jgi:hypothetical protein